MSADETVRLWYLGELANGGSERGVITEAEQAVMVSLRVGPVVLWYAPCLY